ncbi:MAG: hypothetical protein K2X27_25940 [Candidatus Obscuribacterales bacterium]|nr:hypothetical protein [Candidatus Obscuribacterales bacterium]
MFPILFRLLTIAGTCTVAALLTRQYLKHRAELSGSELEQEKAARKAEAQIAVKPAVEEVSFDSGPYRQSLETTLNSIDEILSKAETEMDSPYCRPVTLRALMAGLEKQGEIRTRLNSAAELKESEWQAQIKEAAGLLQSLRSSWQQAVADQQAASKAQSVIDSSAQLLQSYRAPEGLPVDLSLARFSLDAAERLMAEFRFEESFERATSVGMWVGMAETRASLELQLKELGKEAQKEKSKEVRGLLDEADALMAKLGKLLSTDEASAEYMKLLESAFQKTTFAQSELMKVKV